MKLASLKPVRPHFQTSSDLRFMLLMPNIFGFKGGIQVYSRFLLEALLELFPQATYDILLKYDRPEDIRPWFKSDRLRFHCFGRWPRLVQSVLMTGRVFQVGLQHPPSLVISTQVGYGVAGDWLNRWTGVPYWVVGHGLEVWNLPPSAQCKALRRSNRVIAVSHYTRDRLLREQPLDPGQVSVLPNTFDPEQFQIGPKPDHLLQRYGLRPDQPVILTITRLGKSAAYKGYEQILRSLVELRRDLPTIHYILGGKGDDRPRIEALIAELGVEKHVTLAGFIADEELADHYRLCDVFTMPSKGEGFGIVYLEAMACGKPTLAGNQDGAVDPLAQGALGCLIDPDNLSELQASLRQILQGTYPNSLLYQPEALRQAVLERYAFEQFRDKLARLLAEEGIRPEAIAPSYSARLD